jgi:hypothetical protein
MQDYNYFLNGAGFGAGTTQAAIESSLTSSGFVSRVTSAPGAKVSRSRSMPKRTMPMNENSIACCIVATSDEPVVPQVDKSGTTRFRFVNKQPVLVGNFTAGQYVVKTLRIGKFELQFFVKPGSEGRINNYGELMGRALEFYSSEYGAPAFGSRFIPGSWSSSVSSHTVEFVKSPTLNW